MQKLFGLLLLPALAFGQSVPNGGISQGQVWTTAQWIAAWQSKADAASPVFTGTATLNGSLAATVAPTGIMPSTSLGYNPLATSIVSTSDNAADLTGNGTNIPSLAVIQQLYGGSNINDGRNGLSVFTDLTAPTSPTNAYRYYVGVSAYSKAQAADNGTGGSPQGIVEAITGSAQLNIGATNYFAAIGGEFTISADLGSSVAKKAILNLDEWPSDKVQGSVIDAYIWSTAHTGAVGMQAWAQLDANAGVFPLTSTGTVIKLVGSPTIATGFDFAGTTVSGNILQWSAGAYFLGGNGTSSLGQTTFTNTGGGVALTATGGANQYAGQMTGSATTGQSFGLKIKAGSNASDVAFDIQNNAGSADYFITYGDGHWAMGVPAGTYGMQMSSIGAISIFAPFGSSAAALTSNGSPNNWAGIFFGSSTASQSQGLLVKAGTNSSDLALDVQNQTGATDFFKIAGDGGVVTSGQADKGLGTINAGTIYAAGNLVAGGATFTIASGCATVSALTGSAVAGSFATTTTGTCTPVLTLPTAAHGWSCNAKDLTHPVVFTQTATAAASCTVSGATTSGDTIVFDANPY